MSDRLRLAGRLCLQLGIDDPVAWLESVPREVLRFWMAFDRVEPIGETRLQSAVIAHEIAALRHLMLMVNSKPDAKLEHPEFSDYMPSRWNEQKKRKPKQKQMSGFDIGEKLMKQFNVG